MVLVIIGSTDEDADWIKTPKNRAEESMIHDELEKLFRREDDNGAEAGK